MQPETGFNMDEGFDRKTRLDSIEEKLKLNRWSLFIIVSMSALLTIFYVYNAMSVDSLMKDVRILERQHKSLQVKNKNMIIQSSSLQSADRISRIAREKLGMVAPGEKPEIIP